MRAVLATLLVAPWLTWAIVRTLDLAEGYPGSAAVAFTPWVAASAWLPVLGALLLRRRVAALGGLLAAVLLAAAVLPRAVAGEPAARGTPLRVLSINLEYGEADPAAVVALARRERADVLSLQELTPDAVRGLDAAGLGAVLPHRALEPRAGAAGSGLMARFPLTRRDRPNPSGSAQPVARLTAGGRRLEVMAVHPPPPMNPEWARRWREELRALPAAGGRVPRILAGDFNATLDHAELRRLLATGYRDAADATGAGLVATWPADRRVPPLIAIDHVLVDERVGVRAVEVHDVAGTDHRAVLATVVVPRG